MNQDPIRDADTQPDTWLHAAAMFEPLAAAQCYPMVFSTILASLDGTEIPVSDLTKILPDDGWLDFLKGHATLVTRELQGPQEFLAAEIVEQMLRRINERYPVTKGYSPVHIALVAVYRAMRAAHDKVGEEGTR